MNKFLSEVSECEGRVFLVRIGVNIPVDERGNIKNDFRLKAVIPTIKFLIEKKAKVILIGHIGREKKNSLKKVFKYFKKKEKLPVFFDDKTFVDFDNEKIKFLKNKISDLSNGEILLLDNIRSSDLEKKNDENFAKSIAELGDVFVNEAFSVSHRNHASVSTLADQFSEKYLGLNFEKELKFLEKMKEIKKGDGSIFILGGSKIATKLPLLDEIASKFDKVIIGGAIVNNFYKFLGFEIGDSLYDEDVVDLQKYLDLDNLFIPNIVIVKNKKWRVEKEIKNVEKGDVILDISPASFLEIEDELEKAKIVFFNGPLGYYEGGFKDGTIFLLNMLVSENKKNKEYLFVAGGGDTAAAIGELDLENDIDFISTGGGALIEYVLTGELIGQKRIEN